MTTNPIDTEPRSATGKQLNASQAPGQAATQIPTQAATLAPEAYMNQPTVPARELMRLLTTVHPDPHAILGLHPSSRGMVVRVFRPEAEQVILLMGGESPRSMVKTHEAGFFEALVEDRTENFPYRLEVHYPGGGVFTLRDPYAFPLPWANWICIYLERDGTSGSTKSLGRTSASGRA